MLEIMTRNLNENKWITIELNNNLPSTSIKRMKIKYLVEACLCFSISLDSSLNPVDKCKHIVYAPIKQ